MNTATIRIEISPDKLKKARGKRIQSQVARAVGVSRQHLSLIEAGKTRPNSDVLARLCLLYGVEIHELTRTLSNKRNGNGHK